MTSLNEDGTFDVKYVQRSAREKNVSAARITDRNPLVLFARKRDADDLERSSLLAPQHRAQEASEKDIDNVVPPEPRGVASVIHQSQQWNNLSKGTNPFLKYLADGGKRKERGWLRRSEADLRSIPLLHKDGRAWTYLNEDENLILVEIKRELDRVQEFRVPPGSRHMSDLAHTTLF